MIRHNIKQSIRVMLKDKTFTFLNISGFAVGFAVVITIMLFAYKEYSVNSFIPNSEKVYRLVDTEQNQTLIDNSIVPEIKSKYPEIKEAVSIYHLFIKEKVLNLKKIKNNEHLWVHNIISTNNDFFSLMGVKVLASKTNTPFTDKNSIVLTKSTAIKLFGTTDVIDENLDFIGQKLSVSAVVEDIPTYATIDADFYCHEDNKDLATAGSDGAEGRFYMSDIYFSLITDASVDDLLVKMNQSFPKNKSNTKTLSAESVRDIYFSKASYEMNYDKKGNLFLVWIFITIAILTLIMAIFNYVNFTVSQQIATLKNSGVRITNGATRGQIRGYYITSVALSVCLAFILAIFISCFAMPLSSKLLATELNPIWLLDIKFFILLSALLLLVIVICSILPVGFISRLNIQHLFGKSQLKSKKHPLKTTMTVTQVAISMVLLVGLITINKQLKYVKTTDIGFNKENFIHINLPVGFQKYDVLKNSVKKLPFVDNLCYTSYSPASGGSSGGYLYKENGEKIRVRTMLIDENFIKTFGIKLTHGEEFTENDLNKVLYISEAAYKQLDRNIEGKQFGTRSIKGVVNDININSLHSAIIPMCYLFINHYSGVDIRLKKGDVRQQLQAIETIWNETTNGAIFSYNFYDDYYNSLYQKEDRQAQALTLFSIIAFIITCLGLLGQIMQTTQNRIKEIGIRKINGATIKEIVILLNSGFVVSVGIAFVIATPVAYYAMNKWLESFAYKTSLSWWIFALAGLSALVIALLTVSWQSWRTARRNPVEALRYE